MVFNLNISSRRILNAAFSIAVALSGFLMSCSQIEQATPAVGYLHFNTLAVDVTVEGLELTKASVPAAAVPTADDFTYVITNKADGLKYYNKKGLPTEPIALPLGEYKVDIVFGANQFNQAYYVDSKDNVLIQENQPAIVEFDKVPLANAMVAVTLPDMTGHMEVTSITLSDGVSTISVESGEYYFVPVGRTITAFFSGTNSLGESKSVSISVGTPEAQHAYNVVCNLDLPSFTFAEQSSGAIAGRLYLTELASLGDGLDASKIEYQISADGGSSWKPVVPAAKAGYWVINQTKDGSALLSDGTSYQIRAVYGGMVTGAWSFTPSMPSSTVSSASISHTYKSQSFSGLAQPLSVLTGTAVTSNGSDMTYPAIVSDLISEKGSRGVELVNANGDLVRTIGGKETGSMSTVGDWIYLPQGTYTLKPYFSIGDDKIYLSSLSATSPAPEFTVTAYAETSYSRYLNYKNGLSGYTLNLANTDGTAEKIMGIRGIISISDEVLSKNTGLIKDVTLKYGDSSMLSSGTAVTSSVWYPNTVASKVSDTNWELTGRSWGSHTLSASFTFDGVAAKSSTDQNSIVSTVACHITGLPYSYDFYNKNVNTLNTDGWTTHNVEYEYQTSSNNKCTIQNDGSNGYVISPAYFIPSGASVSLQYSIEAQYYRAWAINVSSKSIELRVGATSSTGSVASSYNTYTCNGSNKTGGSFTSYTNIDSSRPQSLTLTNSQRYVSIHHNNANVSAQVDYLAIYGFVLKYL